jgi:hypothetical protein
MTHEIIPVVNYSFPATKWARTAKASEQKDHVISEFIEMLTADSQLKKLEEAIDLYHSLETYFRILERDEIDIPGHFRKVYKKNKARGYYENLDTQTTEPETNAKD